MAQLRSTTSWVADNAVDEGPAAFAVGAVLVALLVAGTLIAAIRLVPAHERLVVSRFGRIARVSGPGVSFLLPFLERSERLSMRTVRLAPLLVRGTTLDGVRVRVNASASCRVVDPALATVASSDPIARTAELVESAVRKEVACTELASLLTPGASPRDTALQDLDRFAAESGVEVIEVATHDVDVVLSSELLHWAEHHEAPRAGRTR